MLGKKWIMDQTERAMLFLYRRMTKEPCEPFCGGWLADWGSW